MSRLQAGAITQPDGNTVFSIWAPSLSALTLELDGMDHAMSADDGWFTTIARAQAGARYKFRTPERMSFPDPASRAQAGDVHDASIVVDPSTYVWRNKQWRNRPWHEAVIYELHVGAVGGFAGVRARLAEIAALGVTAIELMPVADFPGKHNWGYDGVLPYAPDAAYGTPDELRALVDEAHGFGLMVLLDVVYNHFGPDGAYVHAVSGEFFDEGVHTPWGAAIDFKRPEVAAYFTGNALMWLRDYRFDGLRFDAVHAINPPEFLPAMAAQIRAGVETPVHLVLEHEENRASILRTAPDAPGFDAPGFDAPGFDAQWADDFHHCVHVLLTGESEGYYEDFQDPARQLARVLAEGFAYQGETPPHYGRPRGEPSAHLPTTAFVICLQNHDQTGNRAMGERLTALAHPDALHAARALMLLSPFIPLLFMGEEWGTKTPFLFFTDHNDELAPLVREGRRREFAHFAAFKDEARRDQIPDPNAHATFAASIPDPAERTRAPHADLLHQTRRLLDLRATHIVPGIPGARSLGASVPGEAAVTASWRLGIGATLTIQANFATTPVRVPPATGTLLYNTATNALAVDTATTITSATTTTSATNQPHEDLPAMTTRVYLG